MSQKFGVVILAAGASTQVGRPKQLLPYLGRTLIEHAARTALASGAERVVVVVGSNASAIREKLKGLSVRIVANRNWADGKGSSIRCGIAALSSDVECAVIALCDQPKITPELLRSLAQRHFESGSPIVASSYDGVVGAPSAFGAELFPSLMSLPANCGASELIRHSASHVEAIEFSGGNVDIDTPTNFRQLIPPARVEAPQEEYHEPPAARGPPQTSFRSSLSA